MRTEREQELLRVAHGDEDFIEGKETYNLIKANSFPKDKLLFAGLVNGKNIWKN